MKKEEVLKENVNSLELEISKLEAEKQSALVKLRIDELYGHDDENDEVLNELESDIRDFLDNFLKKINIELTDEDSHYLDEHIWNIRDNMLSAIKEDSDIFKTMDICSEDSEEIGYTVELVDVGSFTRIFKSREEAEDSLIAIYQKDYREDNHMNQWKPEVSGISYRDFILELADNNDWLKIRKVKL